MVEQKKPLSYELWSHILCHHYTGGLSIAETDLLFKRIRDAQAPVLDVPMCVVMAFRNYYMSQYQTRRVKPVKRDCWQVRLRESNRNRIFNAVLAGKTTTAEIMKIVDLSRANISHKLYELQCMGLIARTRKGLEYVYSLVPLKAQAVAA